jgi:diguanylate cyclase (GGDEF)-like protein/PAS domain S-box-containing protein
VRVSDGSMRWMHWHNRVVDWDADGRPWEVQAVARDTTERRGLMAELAEARDELLDLHDHAPCGYHSLDAEGRFVRINATELAWLGCRREDLIGRETPLRFFTDEGRAIFQERMPLFVHGPDAEFRAELDLVSLDGTRRRVNVSATKVVDAQGRFVRSRSVMHDITETHRLREQLQRLNRELFAMLDNDLIGIVRLKQRRAVWKNRGLELLTGYGHEELIGQSSRMLYPDEATWQAFGAAAEASFAAGRRHVGDVAMRRKDGSEMMVRLRGERIGNADDEVLWVLVDVTEQRRQLQATERLAFHDALTGLPNRLLMSDRLSQALALAEREQHHVAVGYVDLDGFKAINDAHGHEAGDAVLQAVAQRLSHAVRPHDSVARFGGDEFVILLTQLHDDREHLAVAHRLEQCIAEPIPWQGLSLGVGMSLAFALYPEDSRDPDDLLRLADQGMYRIKARHRDAARSTEAGGLTAPADLRP